MRILVLLFIMSFFYSCKIKEPCKIVSVSSYSEAITQVRAMNFSYTDAVSSGKGSWIDGADYYSCDGNAGYLILKTRNKEYIHEGVPKNIWLEFKNAESIGSYYDKNIKRDYQFHLK